MRYCYQMFSVMAIETINKIWSKTRSLELNINGNFNFFKNVLETEYWFWVAAQFWKKDGPFVL